MGALSALDIALWDIAGKHFGVPVYQLMGGRTRNKARAYFHVFGETKEELVQGVVDAKAAGATAVGHLTPFLDEPRRDSRVPGSGVRGRGSGERETTASSLAGKEESSRKEDNSGQGKDGPAGAIAQGGNGR